MCKHVRSVLFISRAVSSESPTAQQGPRSPVMCAELEQHHAHSSLLSLNRSNTNAQAVAAKKLLFKVMCLDVKAEQHRM